jgi:hypothetical protein
VRKTDFEEEKVWTLPYGLTVTVALLAPAGMVTEPGRAT